MNFGSKIGAQKIPAASSLIYSRDTVVDPICLGFGINLLVPVTMIAV